MKRIYTTLSKKVELSVEGLNSIIQPFKKAESQAQDLIKELKDQGLAACTVLKPLKKGSFSKAKKLARLILSAQLSPKFKEDLKESDLHKFLLEKGFKFFDGNQSINENTRYIKWIDRNTSIRIWRPNDYSLGLGGKLILLVVKKYSSTEAKLAIANKNDSPTDRQLIDQIEKEAFKKEKKAKPIVVNPVPISSSKP